MTRRGLLARVKAMCERITKANGFSTDAGLDVRIAAKNIQIPDHDCVVVFGGPTQYDEYNGTEAVEKAMDLQINVVLRNEGSEERVSEVEEDVLVLLNQTAYEWGNGVVVTLNGLTPVPHELHDLTEAVFSLKLNYI